MGRLKEEMKIQPGLVAGALPRCRHVRPSFAKGKEAAGGKIFANPRNAAAGSASAMSSVSGIRYSYTPAGMDRKRPVIGISAYDLPVDRHCMHEFVVSALATAAAAAAAARSPAAAARSYFRFVTGFGPAAGPGVAPPSGFGPTRADQIVARTENIPSIH